MATKATSIRITIKQVGEMESGLWCRDCALPSGHRVNFEGRSPTGHLYLTTSVCVCGDCNGRNVDPD